jgi:hypothetical protein
MATHAKILASAHEAPPFILSLTAAILIIIVLTAGSSPSALPSLYLFKVNFNLTPISRSPR